MPRASEAQRITRLNSAFEWLRQGLSPPEVTAKLTTEAGISQRQAYRYVEEAQSLQAPLPVADTKIVFTVKLPQALVGRLHRYAESTGQTLSQIVSQAFWSLHWQRDSPYSVQTEQNQLELLMGLTYATPELAHPLGRRFSFGVMFASDLTTPLPESRDSVRTPEFAFNEITSPMRSTEVGPFIEVNLWRRFSVEANAVARKYRQVTRRSDVVGTVPPYFDVREQVSQYSNFWEIPVLAKYRWSPKGTIRGIPVQPFLAMGPSFRTTKELNEWRLSPLGATVAGGTEFRWRGIRLSPEVRLTHWGLGRAKSPFVEGGSPIRRNQVQGMLSVSF